MINPRSVLLLILLLVAKTVLAGAGDDCPVNPQSKMVNTLCDLPGKAALALQSAPQGGANLNDYFDCAEALNAKDHSGHEMHPWGEGWTFIGEKTAFGTKTDGHFYIRRNGNFYALSVPANRMQDAGTSKGKDPYKSNYPELKVSTPEGSRSIIVGGGFLRDGSESLKKRISTLGPEDLKKESQSFDSKVTVKMTPLNQATQESAAENAAKAYILSRDHPPGTVSAEEACSRIPEFRKGPSS